MTDAEDRLKELLKSPYDAEGEVWDAILTAFGGELQEHRDVLADTHENRFIDTANPGTLERIASIFDIEREKGEPIDEFRARVQVALRSQITSATISEIRDIVSIILDADSSDIEVLEPYEFEPAFIELSLPTDFDDALEPSALIDIVRQVTAAGVDVGIRVTTDSQSVLVMKDTQSVGPFDANVYTSFPAIRDEFLVDPQGGILPNDWTVLTDDATVEPFPDNYLRDEEVLTDDQVVEPFPDNYLEDGVIPSDDSRLRADEVEELFWDDGKWDITIWHTFEDLPDEVFSEVVKFADGTRTDPVGGLDTAEVLVVADAGFVAVQVVPSEGLTISDDGSVDPEPYTERSVMTDAVILSPHETKEYFYDEGLWEYGVWTAE